MRVVSDARRVRKAASDVAPAGPRPLFLRRRMPRVGPATRAADAAPRGARRRPARSVRERACEDVYERAVPCVRVRERV